MHNTCITLLETNYLCFCIVGWAISEASGPAMVNLVVCLFLKEKLDWSGSLCGPSATCPRFLTHFFPISWVLGMGLGSNLEAWSTICQDYFVESTGSLTSHQQRVKVANRGCQWLPSFLASGMAARGSTFAPSYARPPIAGSTVVLFCFETSGACNLFCSSASFASLHFCEKRADFDVVTRAFCYHLFQKILWWVICLSGWPSFFYCLFLWQLASPS